MIWGIYRQVSVFLTSVKLSDTDLSKIGNRIKNLIMQPSGILISLYYGSK